MHIENDTRTVTNTLALYGVRRRSRAYYVTRGIIRAAWMLGSLTAAYAVSLTH